MNLHPFRFLSLVFLPLLASCLSSIPQNQPGYAFGPWQTLPASCQVRGIANDFNLSTTGQVEDDTLYMEITFKNPVLMPPQAEITGLPIPIKVEGKDTTYTFQIPFMPPVAAHFMQPNIHLVISYMPIGQAQTFESSLETLPLTQALAQLGTQCP